MRALLLIAALLSLAQWPLLAQPPAQYWSYSTGAGIFSSPALGPDQTICFTSYDYHVYALYPTGTKNAAFGHLPQLDGLRAFAVGAVFNLEPVRALLAWLLSYSLNIPMALTQEWPDHISHFWSAISGWKLCCSLSRPQSCYHCRTGTYAGALKSGLAGRRPIDRLVMKQLPMA